ncbi:MAG TPA: tripartite tricarboxylate transporter TctB family protein [Burkholderiales bacterium]
MKLSRDGWAGLAVAAASLVLFFLTLDLKGNALVPVGPGFYPRIVLGMTVLFCAILVLQDLLSKDRPAPLARASYAAVILHFAVFGLYVAALPGLGFRIATFVYVGVANALMEPPRRGMQWVRVVLLALGTAVATYYVFEHYLSVLLPRGRWTDF